MSYQHKCPVLNHKTHLKVYSALKPPERLLRFCRAYKPPVDNKSAIFSEHFHTYFISQ